MAGEARTERVHIAFFGVCNAGKSSLINAITRQGVALVSDIAGTTTDPIEKAMEILPIGPVQLIDTPGLDDTSSLGKARTARTQNVLEKIDMAVIVRDGNCPENQQIESLITQLKSRNIPYLDVWNKCDLLPIGITIPQDVIAVSAMTGTGIETLKKELGLLWQKTLATKKERRLFANIIKQNDIVVLVTPIDAGAPKGRLILPQVQAIRAALDTMAIILVVQVEQLNTALISLKRQPTLVVTDSQVFKQVATILPKNIPLTSFSILIAAYKGVLREAVEAVHIIDSLKNGAKILISEGCTHHRQCDDIGTKKLPQWIASKTGCQFDYTFTSGSSFPHDLSPYALIIHCGGCMLNEAEMRSRAKRAREMGVAMCNYGTMIAYLQGVWERSQEIVEKLLEEE